jgi:hypothetical protein
LSQFTGSVSGLAVPTNATVSFNGTALVVSAGEFNATGPPGTYWLNASAWGYAPLALRVPVIANLTTALAVVLNASNGWIRGSLLPMGASLYVDGVDVSVGADGSFNVSLAPGSYRLAANASGYESETRTVTVSPGRSVVVPISLSATNGQSAEGFGGSLPLVGIGVVLLVAAVLIVVWFRRRRGAAIRPTQR